MIYVGVKHVVPLLHMKCLPKNGFHIQFSIDNIGLAASKIWSSQFLKFGYVLCIVRFKMYLCSMMSHPPSFLRTIFAEGHKCVTAVTIHPSFIWASEMDDFIFLKLAMPACSKNGSFSLDWNWLEKGFYQGQLFGFHPIHIQMITTGF